MSRLGIVLLATGALSLPSAACAYDGCQVREPRQETVDAAGATTVRVEAKAGFLKITGEEGLTEVQAHGEACAKDRKSLEKVQLRGERSGEEVRIVVDIADGWSNGGLLDLEVRVPAGLAVDIQDGSGEVEVDGVASLRLRDGSGEVDVTDVDGDVSVHDGSGELDIVDVEGSVVLEDGSGEIDVEDVRGGVTVERDGSGDIDIRGVEGDVVIRRDGSGDIHAEDVAGDFTVEKDSSGDISHERIAGQVEVPER
jgi:hypothetical protein